MENMTAMIASAQKNLCEFHAKRSNRYRDMAFFQFFKTADVHHLGLLEIQILTAGTVKDSC